jgi:hypothetical protein
MFKTLAVSAVFAALALSGEAQAHGFTPQADWWSAGQTCVATRAPPGRRWRALPPRTCGRAARSVVREVGRAAKRPPALGAA